MQHSIVGIRSRIESGVELQDTMMMGADFYQTEAEIASLLAEGKVPVGVGQNTKIRYSFSLSERKLSPLIRFYIIFPIAFIELLVLVKIQELYH